MIRRAWELARVYHDVDGIFALTVSELLAALEPTRDILAAERSPDR